MGFDQMKEPMPREELMMMVNFAKSLDCLATAMPLINCLEYRHRGINAPEVWELIDSIKKHFTEDLQREADERMQAYLEKHIREIQNRHELDVDDEQIAKAIIMTVNNKIMKSKRDWGGIYIVLKSKCQWSENIKDFERKIQSLRDRGLLYNIPQGKDFDYQSVVDGVSIDWPQTYDEWMKETECSAALSHRRDVATKFYDTLKEVAEEKPQHYKNLLS